MGGAPGGKHKKGTGKSVEETFKKLSQLEHILLRPDTYIGSAELVTQNMPVWDELASRMVTKEVTYAPGLYKIFDEILVNAADHKQRCASMSTIKVEIEDENNRISVWNDGKGIPVQIHEKEGVYVPELIFGHLLTSSNYDDQEKKVVGGRNGYGAKLANIFSTEFVVETADSESGKKYKQVFRDNMQTKSKPSITSGNKKSDWTKITFSPDLSRFGMASLDGDIIGIMKKRVYDIAGTNPTLKVYLNGEKIAMRSFKDYIALYHAETPEVPFMHERCGDRWEVAIGASQGQLEQVSFVNSIWTIKGGTHVGHVVDQVVSKVSENITKKHKGLKLKPHQIKSHLSVFVNSLIENPAFDSQTKETLTSKPSQFGSKFVLSDDLLKKILRSGITENILDFAKFKQSKELAKTDGGKKARLLGIPKLDDANKAGGRDASKCTLILTEGDSAKSLAISGLSIIGRDYYGVFPLRGKLLNVREATHKQIMDNAEITNLKKILGLQQGKAYSAENIKTLRYGHVLIMTDQDHDGSHIKGLLINFFDHFWPGLLKVDGFLQEFITPIVKCMKGKSEKVFFTIPQYRQWMFGDGSGSTSSSSSLQDSDPARGGLVARTGWKPKYYKGLGSSTADEAKAYFSDLCRHRIPFCWSGDEDGEMIKLAFAKSKVNDRKEWLTNFVPGTFFDHLNDELNYSNFVNKELILFSIADNARSIPNVVDGLKPAQRKVLFACFKRKLTKSEIKVQQLAGYVSEHAAYHHGEASLQSTIVGLAQNFVGSNNANLLVPAGQFGTRLQGGKDAASVRYICTKLAPIARALFPEADDPLLNYLEDDGLSIEPEWYCPVIPTVLVNGADGIGTGWSSQVPCYNPRDLIDNVRVMLRGHQPRELLPWYRGFEGSIVPVGNAKSFDVYGNVLQGASSDVFIVRELPVRTWTTPYKEFLEASISNAAESARRRAPEPTTASSRTTAQRTKPSETFVKEYTDQSTERSVAFSVTLTPQGVEEASSIGVHKKLKLAGSVTTSNMMLFDAKGRIAKYEDTSAIMQEFFNVRMGLYERRRRYLIDILQEELECLDNKQRFILMVVEGKLRVSKRKKADIVADLIKHKFKRIPKRRRRGLKGPSDASSDHEESDEEATSGDGKSSDFDYLLSMPIWSLTLERVDALCAERNEKATAREEMERTTGADLWLHDLDHLESVLAADEARESQSAVELKEAAAKARKAQSRGSKRAKQVDLAALLGEQDLDGENIPPPSARVIRKVVKRTRKTPDELDATAGPPKAAARPTAAKASGKAQRRLNLAMVDVDSEDEDEDGHNTDDICSDSEASGAAGGESDDEDDFVMPVHRPMRSRRLRRDSLESGSGQDSELDRAAEEDSEVATPETNKKPDGASSAIEKASRNTTSHVVPQKQPAGGRTTKNTSVSSVDISHDSDDHEIGAANTIDVSDDDDDDDDDGGDDETMSLAERLARRRRVVAQSRSTESVSPVANESSQAPPKKPEGQASKAVKRSRAPKSTAAVVSKKPPARKQVSSAEKTQSPERVDDMASPSPAPRKKKSRIVSPIGSRTRAPPKRKPAPTRISRESSQASSADADSSSDVVATPPPTRAARPRRETRRVVVVESSDDDADSIEQQISDGSDYDVDDADDSDFE